ncbi:MAG TPA: Gfo/Idh/MocA family oxidoreductase [Candidatus Limnocylindrales bacterium]|nr:Gfo/Idh/MocA family oxidoreductase [Candidatus Limnocylindrales bacterium]
MTGRLRLGLVGTGWITTLHLAALERLARTELVGTVSGDADRAAAVAARWGGASYTDVPAMLDDARPHAVYVCQPPHRAAAACELLVERGIPFLTEKPLAAVGADAERVAAALRGRGLVVAVGYNWRGLDFLPLVRERLAKQPTRLVLARWTGQLPPPPWWRHVAESGGQVVEQATHLYDFARLLVGEANVIAAESTRRAHAVHADADMADLATAILRFDGGAIGSFTNTSILASNRVSIEFLADGMRTVVATVPDATKPTWRLTMDDGAGEQTIEAKRDSYEVQAAAFLDAVEANDPAKVLSTFEDALLTDRLTRAVVAATARPG